MVRESGQEQKYNSARDFVKQLLGAGRGYSVAHACLIVVLDCCC